MIPISIGMVKRDGILIASKALDKVKLDTFLEQIKEGEEVEITYEIKHKDGSYSQLSKLHAGIRALANETGASFAEMKLEVKRRAGLVVGENIKSFADCSKEELSKCIQATIAIGDLLNVNLHGY